MSDLPDAFYLPAGADRYEPTRATESPWDSGSQHGGPPTALLAHAIDATAGPGLRLARITMDFLGPIPRREVRIEVSPVKPGRLVSLSEARMIVDGRTAVTARAWHIATGPPPPATGEPIAPPAPPEAVTIPEPAPELEGWGYGESVEWRFDEGGHGTPGLARVWTRVRVPLIAGEDMTGLARTLVVADSANGLSAVLPFQEWLSIPPSMTTTLLRVPEGEWVHMDCRTHLAPDGIGLAQATLCDSEGHLGEVAQPLLVRER
ncbi:thioesterase family protein [Actinomadura viridis]|uniref:thioesterase family protein n=1 Tax=Actinomadura viridis TaxID=58110 RepID=UPI00369F336C